MHDCPPSPLSPKSADEAGSPDRAALLRSPRFQGHATGPHPENPARIAAIEAELDRADLLADRPAVTFGPAAPEVVERVHAPAYVAAVHELAAAGGGLLDADTIVLPDSVEVALLAAGAAVAATDAALKGTVRRSFVLGRPPGHHATPGRGMGFCLFNQIAVAAAHALEHGVERVLIVDWDVHHGNGTQDAFYARDRVLFCSLHQWPLYPGTGSAAERGIGAGEGATINVPLPAGTGDDAYLHAFDDQVLPAARRYQPELILVSAGFDAHVADPLGGMRLTEQGFTALTERVLALGGEFAGDRVVLVLEGGYDVAALGRAVAAVTRTLDDWPVVAPASSASARPARQQEIGSN